MMEKLQNSKDVIIKDTLFNCEIIYQEQMCSILEFMKEFYPRLKEDLNQALDIMFPGICKKIEYDINNITFIVFSGLLVAKRNERYYAFDLSKTPTRKTSDSVSEPENVFSSRDGFVENYKDNIALIRSRAKDYNMCIDTFNIGKRSKTVVSLLSIYDIHNQEIKKAIIDILNKIDVDVITSLEDISLYFQKGIFPNYQYLGSPNLATRKLYNGQFVIIIDRICTALILPVNISIVSKMEIDNLNVAIISNLYRILVFLSFFISTLTIGLFAGIIAYQNDFLSFRLLSILKVVQNQVIFPIHLEMFVILSIFELFYLLGFRQSKLTISSTVVLIGGIIIGQNIIASGIVGVFFITIGAICFLFSFVVSSNTTVSAGISLIRFIILFSSLYYGVFGIILSSFILANLMYNQKNFGVHYFYPFLPFNLKDFIKTLKPSVNKNNIYRDTSMKVLNKRKRK